MGSYIPVSYTHLEESTNANNIFEKMRRCGYDKMFRGNFTLFGSIRPMKGLSIEASYNYAPDWGDYATWGDVYKRQHLGTSPANYRNRKEE